MIDLNLNKATVNFGYRNVLDGVDFQLHEGDRVGIVGPNGSGKSTMINAIYDTVVRKTQDGVTLTSGDISKRKDATIGYLRQNPRPLKQDRTVREFLKTHLQELAKLEAEMNELQRQMEHMGTFDEGYNELVQRFCNVQEKFTEMGGYEMDSQIEKVAAGLKITDLLDKSYNHLSGGERTKACLAGVLLQQPNVLLLDEPTNNLDIGSMKWLEEFLKKYPGSVMLVSHDRAFLDGAVNKIVDLRDGHIKEYVGNYTAYKAKKEADDALLTQAANQQKREIAKIEEHLRVNQQRAKNDSEAGAANVRADKRKLETMERIEAPRQQRAIPLKFKQGERSGEDVLTMDNVTFTFDGDNPVLLGANLHVQHGDKMALIGENGTGKSTAFKIILDELQAQEGEVKLGESVVPGYLPQIITFPDEDKTIFEEFREHFDGDLTRTFSTLARFHFPAEDVKTKRVGSLSGGEKVRLRLAELIQHNANFLMLDEPTNHLDIENREILEEALQDYPGTILFITHDRAFMDALATSVAELEEAEFFVTPGNYADHEEAKERKNAAKGFPSKAPEERGPVLSLTRGKKNPQGHNNRK